MAYRADMRWMRDRLGELDKSGAELARALGIPKSRVSEMLAGKRRLQPNEIRPVARFLEIPEAQVVANLSVTLNANKEQIEEIVPQIGGNNRQPIRDLQSPLVVYRTVLIEGGRRGGFMLFQEPIDEVPRPFFLKFSAKAFATKILNDDNHPVYKRWDTVAVDPGGSMALGEDHMFSPDVSPDGDIAVIGCLKQITASNWIVHCYGTKQDQELPRSEYPHAWPIVARYNRR
jgi:plasmid maintenance system antidote protein VapI